MVESNIFWNEKDVEHMFSLCSTYQNIETANLLGLAVSHWFEVISILGFHHFTL